MLHVTEVPIIAFPTKPHAKIYQQGYPWVAEACRCKHPFGDGDTCVFCGHYPANVIDATWRDRALQIARA